jgi:hypothetical protein
MSNADAAESARAEGARLAARARWGSRVAVRSAAIVVELWDELPAAVQAEVEAKATRDGDTDD